MQQKTSSHFPAGKRDILLYCGLSERTWNGYPVSPGSHACISPVSGKTARTKKETWVYVPQGTEVIQDSGAFSDHWSERLSFAAALERQSHHAQKMSYENKITHRATYDLLIDEVWSEGNRHKRRWSVQDAESAVDQTVQSAHWLNQHRNGLSLIISAQGVDALQYLRCVQRLMPFFQTKDVLGLGGWCIIGKYPRQMMPVFSETIKVVIPFLSTEGIKRVHIWGVIYPPALATLLEECSHHAIEVSTDSMGPCLNPVYGQWGYGSWRDNRYQKPSLKLLGEARAKHAALTREWLNSFQSSLDYEVTVCRGKSRFADRQSVTVCAMCNEPMIGKRSHSKTCSAKCRKALSRSGGAS